jgi:hypothetical protein
MHGPMNNKCTSTTYYFSLHGSLCFFFQIFKCLTFFQLAWFEYCVIHIGAALPILVLRFMNYYALVNFAMPRALVYMSY